VPSDPKVIRLVRDCCSSVYLVGFKLLSRVSEEQLIRQAELAGMTNRANLTVANDLQTLVAATPSTSSAPATPPRPSVPGPTSPTGSSAASSRGERQTLRVLSERRSEAGENEGRGEMLGEHPTSASRGARRVLTLSATRRGSILPPRSARRRRTAPGRAGPGAGAGWPGAAGQFRKSVFFLFDVVFA
jgi:hypothetical protein